MEKAKILLAEDDRSTHFFIQRFLENKNYSIKSCFDGESAIKTLKQELFDLVLVDLTLPKFNGITVLRKFKDKYDSPVILLADACTEYDEIESYKSGVSILHKKPINYQILEAQITSLIRQKENSSVLKIGDLYLDPSCRLFLKGKKEIILTFSEFNLLYLFCKHPGRIFSRQEILHKVLDDDDTPGAVDTLISRVRNKLKTYGDENIIETVFKSGFRLKNI